MTFRLDRRGVIGAFGASALLPASLARAAAAPTVLANGLAFPEGVVTTRDGGALFVEIGAGRVSRVAADGRMSIVANTGLGPNGAAIGPDGAIYIANNGGLLFEHAGGRWSFKGVPEDFTGGLIQRVDPATGAVKTLYTSVGPNRLKGPNDILCDAWGGLWFTDTGKIYPRSRDHGGLYWAKPDGGALREIAYPLFTPNGLALAPDRRTLYVALSNLRQIVAYTLTGPGHVESVGGKPVQRVIASLGGDLLFDNIAVEVSGNIVIAAVKAGMLIVINPAGDVIEQVKMADPIVTALAFGGPDMRQLFVTLSGAGDLVRLDWPRPGLPPLHRI